MSGRSLEPAFLPMRKRLGMLETACVVIANSQVRCAKPLKCKRLTAKRLLLPSTDRRPFRPLGGKKIMTQELKCGGNLGGIDHFIVNKPLILTINYECNVILPAPPFTGPT